MLLWICPGYKVKHIIYIKPIVVEFWLLHVPILLSLVYLSLLYNFLI